MRQPGRDLVSDVYATKVFQQPASSIEHERVSPLENGQRRQRLECGLQALAPHSVLEQDVAHHGDQGAGSTFHFFSNAGKNQAQVVMPNGGGENLPAAAVLLQQLALGQLDAVSEIVKRLLALTNRFHHAGESSVLCQLR